MDAWGLTPEDERANRERISKLASEGMFTPPGVSGTLICPGNVGGMNWSGYAFHPDTQILVTNSLRIPFDVRLIPRDQFEKAERTPGTGRFRAELAPQEGTPYGMSRQPLLSDIGLPCIAPPWSELIGVDLSHGTIVWRTPLGTTEGVVPLNPPRPYGLAGFGGPIVTAGGLVFIGAAWDGYFRAFDVKTGAELWKAKLPAPAQATPMTYRANGKQFVVIAAGGHGKLPVKLSDAVVAFTLDK